MNKYKLGILRLLATVIDVIVIYPLSMFQEYFVEPSNDRTLVFFLSTLASALEISYFIIMHWLFGQTVGKMLLRISVKTNKDLDKITLWQAFLRDFIWAGVQAFGAFYLYYISFYTTYKIDFEHDPFWGDMTNVMTIWYVALIVSMFIHKKGRALHDLISGTIVIKS